MNEWTQIGVSGATLFILFFIVKYFVAAMNKKDDTIQTFTNKFYELAEKFNVTITNHIEHERSAMENLTKSISGLNTTIKSLPQATVSMINKQYPPDAFAVNVKAAKVILNNKKSKKITK